VLVKLVLVGRTFLGPVDVVYEPEVAAVGTGGPVGGATEEVGNVVVVCIPGKVRLKCQKCQSF
jgi:hypothetical protein